MSKPMSKQQIKAKLLRARKSMGDKERAQRLIERCASQVSTGYPGELWNLEPTITSAFAQARIDMIEEIAQQPLTSKPQSNESKAISNSGMKG